MFGRGSSKASKKFMLNVHGTELFFDYTIPIV
jgi:hypothetical protein